MSTAARLLAIGGGGFCQGSDPKLEAALLAQLDQQAPTIGYIGAANFDHFETLSRFHRRFGELGSNTTDLPSSANSALASRWLEKLDAVFVSGGNTRHLLSHWRSTGQDKLLLGAARSGLMLCGVSAGAMCWFDYALSESRSKQYQPLQGLGLFSGSCCPHYTAEPQRVPEFERLIGNGSLADGIAIDDGAAVLLRGDKARGVYAGREGATAVRVQRNAEEAISTALPQLYVKG